MIRRHKYFERNVVPDLLLTLSENYSNTLETVITYTSGDFSYRYEPEWAKFPEELWGWVISGIACDKEDNIYVTMKNKEAPIVKLNKDGEVVGILGKGLPIAKLHGISIAEDGSIYVADDNNHVVFHLDPAGQLLQQFGTLGVPSDSGYHTDYVDPADKSKPITIKVYSDDGTEVEKIISNSAYKSIQRLAPPFNKPTKMLSHKGRLYASDGYGNAAVHVFDTDGHLLKSWGGPGDEPGKFAIVHSLWIDKKDRIWVCDRENDRVQVFTLDGELLKVLDGLWYPVDVWSDDSYVYVLQNEGRVSIYDMDYDLLAEIGHWQCGNIAAHSMTGDSGSRLYLADCGAKGVSRLVRI